MRGSDIKRRYGAILLAHHHRLNGIDDLPDVVLMEILCRLPCYKFVSQCKCVSKRWCSLISDPYFIGRCHSVSLHREYHHQQTPIILININRELLNIMSDPLKPFFERLMKFYGLIQEPEVAGTYNDLLLCYTGKYYERNYYICNPYTQQWIALPPTPPCHGKIVPISEGFMCDLPYYNNAAKDDDPKGHNNNSIAELNSQYRCKVVRLICRGREIKCSKFEVQIFSSETGEWRESIVSSPQDIYLGRLSFQICFANAYNRMLYWGSLEMLLELDPFKVINNTSSTSTSADGHGDDIIDDHHYNYKFRLISLNDDDFEWITVLSCLGAYGGRLKMYDHDLDTNTFFVWDVNLNVNYQQGGEIFHGGFETVCLENKATYLVGKDMVTEEDSITECIALDPNNQEILYLAIEGDIVKFNTRTKMWSKIDKKIALNYTLFDHFFLLMVPWWPTPVPTLPKHADAQSTTKNHQNQLEEEMGKVMESAPSVELLSSREACGGAAPDEEDVKLRVAKKPWTQC